MSGVPEPCAFGHPVLTCTAWDQGGGQSRIGYTYVLAKSPDIIAYCGTETRTAPCWLSENFGLGTCQFGPGSSVRDAGLAGQQGKTGVGGRDAGNSRHAGAEMADIVDIWDVPKAKEMYAIAGWEQWANAGSVSSDLPEYLVEHLQAQRIGCLHGEGFYLFQLPATHDLMRPEIEFKDGHCHKVQRYSNDIYYAGNDDKGLVIFSGCEPHIDVDRYAAGFFGAMQQLGVKRTVGLGGVFGAMPYRRDRQVSCVYSLPVMQKELTDYAVTFSNYHGGASLGSYLSVQASELNMEYCNFYSMVPAYDLSQFDMTEQGMRVDYDFRAWYELMRRLNVMFNLQIDLTELEDRSQRLTDSLDEQVDKLCDRLGHDKLRDYFKHLEAEFEERSYLPYESVWEDELGEIFDDLEDNE